MRIFVTGATGVLGSRAVPLMLEAGHEVTAVGRSPEKRALLERQGARAVDVDLFNLDAVRRAVRHAEIICSLADPPFRRPSSHGSAVVMARDGPRPASRLGGPGRRRAGRGHGPAPGPGVVRADLRRRRGRVARRVLDSAYRPVRSCGLDAEADAARFARAGRMSVLRFGILYGPEDRTTATVIRSVRRGWFPLLGRPDAFLFVASTRTRRERWSPRSACGGRLQRGRGRALRRRELANGIARLLGVHPPRLLPGWAAPLGGVVEIVMRRWLRVSNRSCGERAGRRRGITRRWMGSGHYCGQVWPIESSFAPLRMTRRATRPG